MKKIIWGIIGIPFAIGLCYLIGYIAKGAFFLVLIDNTDFGFPLWLDISIDIFSGVIAYIFMLSLYGISNKNREQTEQIISIIVGFVISFATHCLLKYWYIVVAVLVIFVITTIILLVRNKEEKKNL